MNLIQQDSRQMTTITQWHFKDKTSITGVLLDSDTITIHTTKYNDFDTLINKFEGALIKFNSILNISLFERLGLRYINVIDSNFDKYVSQRLLGFSVENEKKFKKSRFLSRTETTQESTTGIIKIQSTNVGSTDLIGKSANYLVPPGLIQIADSLLFEHHKQPKNQYLLLDIDYFSNDQKEFDTKNITNEFAKLHEGIHEYL